MMKRFLTCTLTLAALVVLAVPARADLLWEPADDLFFRQHNCIYEDRSYYANGEDGFVTLWDAPDGSAVQAQYQNGEALWAGYTYKDWALISHDGISGWVPLSDLYLIYDHISFEEEYGNQFRDYNGEFADYEGKAGESFWYWEYPHAGGPEYIVKIHQQTLDELQGKSELGEVISKVYTDQNGHDWGYIEWMYDLRNVWLLLDNPTCNGIMTSCTSEVDILIDSGEIVPPREPVIPGVSYTPYILVTAVAAVTAGLLRIFWKKKK